MKKNIKQILTENRSLLRLFSFVFIDGILIFLSVFLAFLLRFELDIPSQYLSNIFGIILLGVIITLPIFYFSKLYYFSWIYVSTAELISLVKAVALSFLLLAALFLILRDHPIFTGFPRSTLFITYFFVFILAGTFRLSKRIYLQIFGIGNKKNKEKTLIAGAGDAGEQILRSILSSKTSPFLPIGFVDDNFAKQGILIHGMNVLGRIDDIPKLVKEKGVKELIIALPSAGSEIIMKAVGLGRKSGLKKIKIVPPIDEIMNGRVGLGSLRDVEMESLLGRTPISLKEELIIDSLKNKKVLVTGAAGSIGSELCRQIIKFNPQRLFLLDQDETGIFNIENELKVFFPKTSSFIADVQDKKRINNIFKDIHPNVVFHAAAYKHVPVMENNPEEAIKNNVKGTLTLAKNSLNSGVERFIFISTDKAVNPSSIMGATKRIGEMICQALNQKKATKFISVRFGNVLGSRGSVIPIFKEKIKKREPIEITHPEMKRYFMTTPEACLLVLMAGSMGEGGEVFVLDMGDPVNIMDLAKELIKLSGLEPDKDIPIVYSEPRPGEKFFEELLTAEEGTVSTRNEKIFMAKLSEIKEKKLHSIIEELDKAAEEGEKEKIKEIIRRNIPSFK